MLNCLLGKRFATVLRTTFPIILHGVIKKNQDQLMNFISFLFFWFKMTQKRWNHNKKKKWKQQKKHTMKNWTSLFPNANDFRIHSITLVAKLRNWPRDWRLSGWLWHAFAGCITNRKAFQPYPFDGVWKFAAITA